MSLSVFKEVDSDTERLRHLANNRSNKKKADQSEIGLHLSKRVPRREDPPDEKEKGSSTFKHCQRTRNSEKHHQPDKKRVVGTVEWFNIKHGYGFVTRNDTREDVFAHRDALATERRLGNDGNQV